MRAFPTPLIVAALSLLGCDGQVQTFPVDMSPSGPLDMDSPRDVHADASPQDVGPDVRLAQDVSISDAQDLEDVPDVADVPDMPQRPLKAFPSAYGAAAGVTGGRGGVLIVVNTDDPNAPLRHFAASGADAQRYEGGLYAALQHPEPAYITFDRSMNIRMGTRGTGGDVGYDGIPGVRDKTIFGQSAPRGGVTITGGTLRFTGRFGDAKNLIFRYFRSRPIQNSDGEVRTEDDAYTWALLFYGGSDVIVDHCSFSFAQDKAMGAFIDQNSVPENEMKRFTFSRNHLGDSHTSHYIEINPDRPEDPETYVDHFSLLANLTVGMNRTPNIAYDGFAELINTVNYGLMSKQSTVYHDLRLNHIANYHAKSTPRTDVPFNRVFTYDDSTPQIYTSRNHYQGLLEGSPSEDNRTIWRNEPERTVDDRFFVPEPFDPGFAHPYPALTAAQAFDSIVLDGDIGAYQYLDDEGRPQVYRDTFDTSQLEIIRAGGTYRIKDPANWVLPVLPETRRPPSYDSDHDGMADAWEMRVFGDLSESYNGDPDGDGYTNIEAFMNQVDRQP